MTDDDLPEPGWTDPVPWDLLLSTTGRTEMTAVETFERHRAAVEGDSIEEAVARLYEALHEEYDAEDRPTDQGAAFLFAYLLERAGIASLDDAPLPSLVDRRPDDDELERLFWAEGQVPWWIAVRLGVHYSLVQFWLYEADVPLMWRNVAKTDELRAALAERDPDPPR